MSFPSMSTDLVGRCSGLAPDNQPTEESFASVGLAHDNQELLYEGSPVSCQYLLVNGVSRLLIDVLSYPSLTMNPA